MNGTMSSGITALALVWFFTSDLCKIEAPGFFVFSNLHCFPLSTLQPSLSFVRYPKQNMVRLLVSATCPTTPTPVLSQARSPVTQLPAMSSDIHGHNPAKGAWQSKAEPAAKARMKFEGKSEHDDCPAQPMGIQSALGMPEKPAAHSSNEILMQLLPPHSLSDEITEH